MKEKRKKLPKRIIALIVFGAIIISLASAYGFMELAFMLADRIACWRPDYGKVEIGGILEKNELSDEDYKILYSQTGLTKAGIDRCRSRGLDGRLRVERVQKDYFAEHTVTNAKFAPLVCTDRIEGYIQHVYLEPGDILVTSATHLTGWRIGHAGLVTSTNGNILQANAIGDKSTIASVTDFTSRVNFMIFTVKDEFADEKVKNEVATYAKENLLGKVYDPTAGVLSDKNKVDRTQCAHIVWYAWKQFGIDLDCNGGPVVTPKNIANSDKLELLQVFGFDPQTLWK